MSQRFSVTPAKSAADLGISDSVFRTLAVIGIYGDRNGWCWPSQKTIAEIRGVSRQTVSAHIKTLIGKGYINTQPRFDEETGAQKSNMMQIKFDFEFDPPVKPKTLHPLSSQELDTPRKAQGFTHNAPINDTIEREEKDSVTLITRLVLAAWSYHFPNKPQPKPSTKSIQDKIRARWKDDDFRDRWVDALAIASLSPTLQEESWFDLRYFLRNEDNYKKCLDQWMKWKDDQRGKVKIIAKPKRDYDKAAADFLAKMEEK